jgi:hypothetical protein
MASAGEDAGTSRLRKAAGNWGACSVNDEPLDLSLAGEETESVSGRAAAAGDGPKKVSEMLLKTVLSNLDGAKKDLDKHWMYVIAGTVISLAIAGGLGGMVWAKLVGEKGPDKLLYVLMPLANLYLFMRFGFLLAYFTGVRLAAEELADQYFSEEKIKGETLSPHLLFGTNSYFEYIHERKRKVGLLLYSVSILFVLALNNAASLTSLWLFFGGVSRYAVVLFYFSLLGVCCYHYYDVNKGRRIDVMGARTILIAVFINLSLTLMLFFFFIHLHRLMLSP